MNKGMTGYKRCTHWNSTVICQYKKYRFIKDKAIRTCCCKEQCPVKGGKP